MIFTGDLLSFLTLLNENHVEYMIIGGAAVNIHGFSRSTGDMDIWFNPTQENFERLSHFDQARFRSVTTPTWGIN